MVEEWVTLPPYTSGFSPELRLQSEWNCACCMSVRVQYAHICVFGCLCWCFLLFLHFPPQNMPVGGLATQIASRCEWVCTRYPAVDRHPNHGAYSWLTPSDLLQIQSEPLTKTKHLLKGKWTNLFFVFINLWCLTFEPVNTYYIQEHVNGLWVIHTVSHHLNTISAI